MIKSFDVLSDPFPVADPNGSGAGVKPQFPFRILSASIQYFSPLILPRSILSAADPNKLAAFLSASSLLPIISCELKACTEIIAGGLVTRVGERWVFDNSASAGGVDKRAPKSSFACDISPKAILEWILSVGCNRDGYAYKSCGNISILILNSSSTVMMISSFPSPCLTISGLSSPSAWFL